VIPPRITLAVAGGLAAALALSGCGGSDGGNTENASNGRQAPRPVTGDLNQGAVKPTAPSGGYGTNDGSAAGTAPGATSPAPGGIETTGLKTVRTKAMGTIVTDAKGWTLYRFDKDTPKPAKSNCNDKCAQAWPPALAKDVPQLTGIDRSLVGTVVRADGKVQLTLAGWPMYRYAKDLKPGDWKGVGVGGTWYAFRSNGKKADCPPGMNRNDRGGDRGAGAADVLVAKRTKSMGTYVTDGRGMTLYRFDKDTVRPSRSNCTGGCLKKWPPLIVTKDPAVRGVDKRLVGKIRRADGRWQATLNGSPLYYFAEDKKPGDWKGIGVGEVWWAVSPSGKRIDCRPGRPDPNLKDRAPGAGGGGYGDANGGRGYGNDGKVRGGGNGGYGGGGAGGNASGGAGGYRGY
jgi:predicted lipoprotein with Yx(FWY)xxD motif